jgi:transcriptional antiterminator RfaH
MTALPDQPAPWYVAHTKPRQERTAAEQLRRQDFEVYLPLFKTFCEPGRRRRPSAAAAASTHTPASPGTGASGGQVTLTTHEPMFPRYLFLRPTRTTQSLSVVRSTVGVSKLVMFGPNPATLADAAVQSIRLAETTRETADLADLSPYRPGMTVRLQDPALQGIRALVQAVSADRVTLLLDILGRPQTVQVEFGRIAPV